MLPAKFPCAFSAAPLQVPGEPAEKAKKTPERIEFEISFDGEEETEEEQFEHNLRASMSSDTILDDSDEEDDDSDDEYVHAFFYEVEKHISVMFCFYADFFRKVWRDFMYLRFSYECRNVRDIHVFAIK